MDGCLISYLNGFPEVAALEPRLKLQHGYIDRCILRCTTVTGNLNRGGGEVPLGYGGEDLTPTKGGLPFYGGPSMVLPALCFYQLVLGEGRRVGGVG